MKYLFYLAHPAHFHLFRNTIKQLSDKGHDIRITIKAKDVLQRLLEESGMPFINIAEKERGESRLGVAKAFATRTRAHWEIARTFRPDLFISTSAEFAPFGKLLGIKSIAVFEDDLEIFPVYSRVFVPFLSHQLCPESCSAARWNNHPKTIKYKANQELAYLRPAYFNPDISVTENIFDAEKPNFFIRFAKLTAWHDENKTGITDELALKIINTLTPYGKVHLSSERPLPESLEPYRVRIRASDILHVLSRADLYIGDSQTMTAEAAVLGTPAIRFNDFVGKLGYLEELEHRFGLTIGIPTHEPERLIKTISELASRKNLKNEWKEKRKRMLSETIDPTRFMTWFFDHYPNSATELKNNPQIQEQFKDHGA
jgi:predicted glycosyltransferase